MPLGRLKAKATLLFDISDVEELEDDRSRFFASGLEEQRDSCLWYTLLSYLAKSLTTTNNKITREFTDIRPEAQKLGSFAYARLLPREYDRCGVAFTLKLCPLAAHRIV